MKHPIKVEQSRPLPNRVLCFSMHTGSTSANVRRSADSLLHSSISNPKQVDIPNIIHRSLSNHRQEDGPNIHNNKTEIKTRRKYGSQTTYKAGLEARNAKLKPVTCSSGRNKSKPTSTSPNIYTKSKQSIITHIITIKKHPMRT